MIERTHISSRLFGMVFLTAFAFVGCGPNQQTKKSEGAITARISVEGTARQAKTGPLVALDDGSIMWVDLDEWPDEVSGKRVIVSGITSTRSDLPVFIRKEGEPIRSGIPVPEGTDLTKASQRQVLTKVQFKLAEEDKP